MKSEVEFPYQDTCIVIKGTYDNDMYYMIGNRSYFKDKPSSDNTLVACHIENNMRGQTWLLTQKEPRLYSITFNEDFCNMNGWRLYVDPLTKDKDDNYPVLLSNNNYSLWEFISEDDDSSFQIQEQFTGCRLNINPYNKRDLSSYYLFASPIHGLNWSVLKKQINIGEEYNDVIVNDDEEISSSI